MDNIKYWQTYQIEVGGLTLTIGAITKGGGNMPAYLYAAALDEVDLRRDRAGFGKTEQDAVAALFNKFDQ